MFGTTPIIIFDDGHGELGPMTDLRASFEVRTGMLTTAERITARRPESLAGYWVPRRLADLVGERADAPVNEMPSGKEILCVNGRWRSPDRRLRFKAGEASTEQDSGHVVAVLLPRDQAEEFLQSGELPQGVTVTSSGRGVLYSHPWDVMSILSESIVQDIEAVRMLDAKVPAGLTNVVGAHPVEVHETARLYPNAVLDAERGPIVVHERAIIRPGAVICGPCSIGRESVVVDHALVKPNTVIGPRKSHRYPIHSPSQPQTGSSTRESRDYLCPSHSLQIPCRSWYPATASSPRALAAGDKVPSTGNRF